MKVAFYLQRDDFPINFIINKISLKINQIKPGCKIYYYVPKKMKFKKFSNCNFIYDEKLDYLLKIRDPRMYDSFITFLIKKKIDIAYFYRLDYPEFLKNDLENLKNKLLTKIVFMSFAYEIQSKSETRSNILINLIKRREIKKVILPSLLGTKSKGPTYWERNYNKIKKKIAKIDEYKINDITNYSCIPIKEKKVNVLYFGQPFFGKGLDILINSSLLVSKNIHFLIVTNLKNINFIPNKSFYKIIRNKNITFINRKVSESEKKSLFIKSDVVCIPYRKSYEYGTSAVFLESLLFNKPVIAPNIEPFKTFIKIYNVGFLFKCENAKDLASKINFFSKKINYKKFLINRNKYLKHSNTWSNVSDLIIN